MAVIENYAVILDREVDTIKLGAEFALNIRAPFIIWLQGDLGAGKTTFTRGLINAFGHHGSVKSPTYNIVESYPFQGFTINHFDLYRFQSPEEWLDAGLDEFITPESINLIEWPQLGEDFIPNPDIILNITSIAHGRQADLLARTDHGKHILASIIK